MAAGTAVRATDEERKNALAWCIFQKTHGGSFDETIEGIINNCGEIIKHPDWELKLKLYAESWRKQRQP
jgi:hypothetical protein